MSHHTPTHFVDYYPPLNLWAEVRAYPTDGGMSVFLSDISAQKRAEAEQQEFLRLERERADLLKLNRAKDEFIGIASHQLRTPATAVKQYVGIVMSGLGGPLTDNQRSYLETAYQSNERQLNLINDLLKTAQIDADSFTLSRSPYDLAELLHDIGRELQPMFESRKQRLIITCPDQSLRARIDSREMGQVVANLFENASKYSHEGDRITVTLHKKPKKAVIAITDEGVGIAFENQAKIFDKFTRVDNELSDTVTGTGLGLYWVKHIIEMHGGTIRVQSQLRKGSTFTVTLPL